MKCTDAVNLSIKASRHIEGILNMMNKQILYAQVI